LLVAGALDVVPEQIAAEHQRGDHQAEDETLHRCCSGED
jgi:hypothetical protein